MKYILALVCAFVLTGANAQIEFNLVDTAAASTEGRARVGFYNGQIGTKTGKSGKFTPSAGDKSAASGTGTPGLVMLSTNTGTALQTAINNATPGTTICWSGTLTVTSTIEIQNKTDLTFRGFGQAVLTSSTLSMLVLLRGGDENIGFYDLKFQSTATTGSYPLLYSNQEGTLKNIVVERCSFTNASATNGIGFNNVGGASSQFTTKYTGLTVRACRFVNIGRIAIEVTNHAWDGTATQYVTEDVLIENNYLSNLGTMDSNGMGISLSGLIRNASILNNYIYDAKGTAAIEIVGCDQVRIIGNHSFDINNTTCGIGISDGYKNGSMVGQWMTNILVQACTGSHKDKGFFCYYGRKVTFNNVDYTSTNRNEFKYTQNSKLIASSLYATNSNNALYLEQSSWNTIQGNDITTYPTQKATVTSVIWVYTNSNNNIFRGNTLTRPVGSYGGSQTHIEQTSGVSNNVGTNTVGGTSGDNNYIER